MVAENFDRLPKWAQQRIETLEANVDYWKKKATAGPENSNTFVTTHGLEVDQPLGTGPTVRFMLKGEVAHAWRNSVDARVTKEGRLLLMGTDSIAVFPQSSNVVEVELRR